MIPFSEKKGNALFQDRAFPFGGDGPDGLSIAAGDKRKISGFFRILLLDRDSKHERRDACVITIFRRTPNAELLVLD